MTLDTLLTQYTAGGGELSGAALDQAGSRAWSHLLQQTMGRIRRCKNAEQDSVLRCFRELTDTIAGLQTQPRLSRETVGDWTRTYTQNETSLEETCREIIRRHLGETGLLYRGWPK